MNTKVFALTCLMSLAQAAPSADPEAEAFGYGHAAPVAYTGPAPNCVTEDVILITQTCTPHPEEVCSTEIVATEEIEYEKVCKEIVDTLCDAAPYHHGKREAEADADADAEAEADPLYLTSQYAHSVGHAGAGHVAVTQHVTPVAHAVAHSVTATVKHACREVTTEHCVDNPKVKEVPIDVEHCHTVTKVTCEDVENKLPMTTCEAVVTTATHHATVPVAVPVASVAHPGY